MCEMRRGKKKKLQRQQHTHTIDSLNLVCGGCGWISGVAASQAFSAGLKIQRKVHFPVNMTKLLSIVCSFHIIEHPLGCVLPIVLNYGQVFSSVISGSLSFHVPFSPHEASRINMSASCPQEVNRPPLRLPIRSRVCDVEQAALR